MSVESLDLLNDERRMALEVQSANLQSLVLANKAMSDALTDARSIQRMVASGDALGIMKIQMSPQGKDAIAAAAALSKQGHDLVMAKLNESIQEATTNAALHDKIRTELQQQIKSITI